MSSTAKLSARERIETLLDDNSFVEIGALVTKRSTDFNLSQAEAPGDGVITGYGVVNDRPVYVYAQDASALNGTIGEMHAAKIVKLYELAAKVGAPVVGLMDCAGLRLQEASDALSGFGKIYAAKAKASGIVPQITAVYGNCGGGCAVLAAMSDFVFMTKDGKLFVNAPNAIDENYTAKCDTADAAFAAKAGTVDFVDEDEVASLNSIRRLLAVLPLNNKDEAVADSFDDLNRETPAFTSELKNVADAVKDIADGNEFIELKAAYAPDMVTGFIKLNGSTVGVIANNEPVLSTKGCYKAEKLVNFCDAFEIPLLTLTNVKGYASTKSEEASVGIASAKLTYSFTNASVPKINLVTGKAYGSAYITMNSKSIGADFEFALDNTEIGLMDAELAAQIIYAPELEAAADKVAFKAEKTKEIKAAYLVCGNAAKRGYVDSIIAEEAVRKQLIYAFEMLYTKREDRPARKHGTVL